MGTAIADGQFLWNFGPWMLLGLLPTAFGLGLLTTYYLTKRDPAPGEPAWVVSARTSTAASLLAEAGDALRGVLDVPVWMQDWMRRVERDVRVPGP